METNDINNDISKDVAHILADAGLVIREYISGGRTGRYRILIIKEGTEEENWLDEVKLRVKL